MSTQVFLFKFDVVLMDKKCALLSKTRTFLSDPKLFNGSVHTYHSQSYCCAYQEDRAPMIHFTIIVHCLCGVVFPNALSTGDVYACLTMAQYFT